MKKKTRPNNKTKVKLLKRLPKKLGDEAYAYTAALLEDVNSNFRIFGENQSILSGKVEALTHEVGTINENISGIKTSQDIMRADIAELKERQTRMEADINEIKAELKSIRKELSELRAQLSQKADIERFNNLEERVARIEQTLQSWH